MADETPIHDASRRARGNRNADRRTPMATQHDENKDGGHYVFRSDLKPVRISSESSCGCSHAAKWPPLGS